MSYRSSSSADFFDFEEREEMRFLRALKGVLRQDVAAAQDREKLTQEELAERLGVDPAQLSRILSPDRHNSTNTLFRIMHRLGRRWTFGSAPLPAEAGNRSAENSARSSQQTKVLDFFTRTENTAVAAEGSNSRRSTILVNT